MIKKIVTITLSLFVFVFAVLLVSRALVANNTQPQATNTPTEAINNSPQSTTSQNQTTASNSLSASSVANHKTASDCWLIINNKVYDVSTYLNAHPGGADIIIQYCGNEATNAFNTKDMGAPHSNRANTLLEKYYIGDLAN